MYSQWPVGSLLQSPLTTQLSDDGRIRTYTQTYTIIVVPKNSTVHDVVCVVVLVWDNCAEYRSATDKSKYCACDQNIIVCALWRNFGIRHSALTACLCRMSHTNRCRANVLVVNGQGEVWECARIGIRFSSKRSILLSLDRPYMHSKR